MTRVIIVGGGIAGLATAYYLQEGARAAGIRLEYILIESRPRFGGTIVTDRLDGFVIEGGPDCFLSQKPWALELCQQLGLADRLIGTNDERRKVYVLWQGRLHELPEGVMLIVPTRFAPFLRSSLLSLSGKLRMGLDLVIPPKRDDDDESLADFVRRRLGSEALEKIAEPLMAGIHVADPERLSLKATFPRFIELEKKHGSLIRGMLAQRRRAAARGPDGARRRWSMFVSLRGGLTELVEALVGRLSAGSLMAGRRVVGLSRPLGGAAPYTVHLDDGTSLRADAVVLATPAYITAHLLEGLNPSLAGALRAIPYVSTATVSLGYKRADLIHPLDGFGFVVPKRENRKIMACTWTSAKFDGRAPHDHVLLRGFIGGTRAEHLVELDDEAMVRMVQEELRAIMGVTAEPVLARVYRWEKASPQYEVGHLERVAALEAMCAPHPGLFLTGSAYRGVGIPDCIHDGALTAERVLRFVNRSA
ncbi:MAG: protoporphyrinogen oxidase [Anaerolineae bacterium]